MACCGSGVGHHLHKFILHDPTYEYCLNEVK